MQRYSSVTPILKGLKHLNTVVSFSVSLSCSEGWRPESTGGGVVIRPSPKGRPLNEYNGVRLLLSVLVIVRVCRYVGWSLQG